MAATGYVQPRLSALADGRVLSDARLAVQLVGSLSLTVAARLRHDSRPPDDTGRLDPTIAAAARLEW